MYVGVQPKLVERVVFEAARRDVTLQRQYERQYADCYGHLDGAQRDQAFAALHEKWFTELSFRDLLTSQVASFPFVSRLVDRLMVTQAPGARAQTVELFGTLGHYTVVMAVAPATLLENVAFRYWARHELMHVDDMLNPDFGFDLAKRPGNGPMASRDLSRDRYATLWAIAVDARLEKEKMLPDGVREKRCSELTRAFGYKDPDEAARVFENFWNGSQSVPTTHPLLLQWSNEGLPGSDLSSQPGGRNSNRAGLPCPLCGFPTFEWMEESNTDSEWVRLIEKDYPQWTCEQGLCARCAEVYRTCVVTPMAPT
jgi:hypothetical protein